MANKRSPFKFNPFSIVMALVLTWAAFQSVLLLLEDFTA